MKNLFNITALTFLLVGCTYTAVNATATIPTFKPSFVTDYTDCGTISHSEGSVQIGDASTSCSGIVVSDQGYKNISQIRFTADLSC